MKGKENFQNISQDVLTLDEVSAFLRVPSEKLLPEIAAGRLQALRIADEVRILRVDLINYLDQARAGPQAITISKGNGDLRSSGQKVSEITFDPAKAFDHTWPNRQKEHYDEAYCGRVEIDGSLRSVTIGFTERATAGRIRRRAVVFVDRRPLVEFVASDDFDQSGRMLSLVKRKTGKRLRPGETTPGEYRHLKIEPYRKYVTGPYTSTNQAVVCSKSDLAIMADHALIRLRQVETRQ